MKIIADSKIPFLKGVLESCAEVEYYPGKEINAEKVKDADALIVRTRTQCNEKLLKGSNVKFIATATIGFDHIDTKYCKKNDIVWTNAPGCNSGSVMQYIASVLVRLSQKHNFHFSQKTIGIVGVGNVGKKVARLAEVLGMNVLLNDPPRERNEEKSNFVSIGEIKEKADIITFHVPLNKGGKDKTFHLFDDIFLSQLKQKPIIINSARGEVVNGEVLKKGLKERIIKAAVLDVWEKEPNIDLELLKLVEIATPHIAGYSLDGKANGTKMAIRAISKFFKLGIDNWQPEISSGFEKSALKIDSKNQTKEQTLEEIILQSYDVLSDDNRLRNSPQTFEEQRGNYPVRREFEYYISKNPNLPEIIKMLFPVSSLEK
jgi:erythronate-4-phosphate dehydrogenase